MELFQWGTNPWGQETLIRVSWDLLYLFFWAGIAFIVFHVVYAAVWLPKLARANGGQEGAAAAAEVPETIERHTLWARVFHWVMAASMLVLLVTGFFPIIGIQFAWVTIHWIAGVVLTISILYHIVHATFFLDFWSIWILPDDMDEAVQRVKRQMGQEAGEVQKHGKYPLDHKLYHTAVMLAGLAVIGTGLVMMFRIENVLVPRNAYLLAEETWGLMYTLHGLGSVLFVMLTLTHIYFAIRPDKFWLTKSMLFGSVDREQYLAHHDPKRWVVSKESTSKN
jgi:cytochrome b subunit of formate dehydrogenase